MSLRGAVEAALLAAGGPIPLADLARVVGSPPEDVEEMLKTLRREFKEREGGIEIAYLAGGSWVLQVHRQYVGLVQRLVPLEMEPGLLKTLSLVALLQPVCQAKVVEKRGASAYNHIRRLARKGLVTKEPAGNSYTLRTTSEFSRRFRLKDDPEAIRQAMFDRAKILDSSAVVDEATALVERLVAGEQLPAQPFGGEPAAEGTAAVLGPEPGSSVETDAGAEPLASSPEAAPSETAVPPPVEAIESPGEEETPPDNVTRLADHESRRHRIIEARERVIWPASQQKVRR